MRNAMIYVAMGWALLSCSEEASILPVERQAQGYVKLTLCLPEGASLTTKSANDQFESGRAEEYAVHNGLIAYFQAPIGASEAEATFVEAQPLDLSPWNVAQAQQNVTTRQTLVAQAPVPDKDTQLYALVLLNRNRLVTLTEEGMLLVDERPVERLSDLQQAEEAALSDWIGEAANSFFMASAPVADRPAERGAFRPQVSQLTPVTTYRDLPTAETPAERLFVERAVAKVEVAVSGQRTILDDGTVTMPVGGQRNHRLRLLGWRLEHTNRTAKPVRDVSGYADWATYSNAGAKTALNRFFGTEPDPYRIYWAVDGNYGDAPADDEAMQRYVAQQFHTITADEAAWLPMYRDTESSTAYCLENTCPASEMRPELLTSVVVETEYQLPAGETNAAGDLFTMGGSTAVYGVSRLEATINQLLHRSGATAYQFVRGTEPEGAVIQTPADYARYFATAAGEPMSEADAWTLIDSPFVETIYFYRGGKSYYHTWPIQHFGDYYTPVGEGESYSESAHLGRYGVVRNQWYVVYIEGVTSPGYPVLPQPKPDPDPGVDPDPDPGWNPDPTPIPTPDPSPDTGYGLRTTIHVRPWTVRYQEVEF